MGQDEILKPAGAILVSGFIKACLSFMLARITPEKIEKVYNLKDKK